MAKSTDKQVSVGRPEAVSQSTAKPIRETVAAEPGQANSNGDLTVAVETPAVESPRSGPEGGLPASILPRRGGRRALILGAVLTALLGSAWSLTPVVQTAFNTVSTDDAYVNGHVTFLAPRVAGQVSRVVVDDNMRVKRGDVLVELDKEPYQVQVAIRQAAVEAAEKDLVAARAQVRGLVAQARSNRYKLEHAMEGVRNQVELLRSNVAQLKVEEANFELARRDYNRGEELVGKGAVSKQQFDQYKASLDVARNHVISAEQTIQQTRAGLGLPIDHEKPLGIPEDLEQNFSTVREALGALMGSATQLGFLPKSWDLTPQQAFAAFYEQDPDGNLDRIYEQLIPNAPAVKQAEAKLKQAHEDLSLAQLNLRYCDIVSEIDGVVTRRNVNAGNNVQAGQALMAVRSLTEIWIDANFKETQLADLRIGQRVRCEFDMYGSRREYEGRITGFTMGTGQTLSLLPPQNATGNFVKIVQRLPVRIELTNYNPDHDPIFVGVSVTPYVYFKEKPEGPDAGEVLQPGRRLPRGMSASEVAEQPQAAAAVNGSNKL